MDISQVISGMLCCIWPTRRQQELLLDLGERKDWGVPEREGAVQRFAEWLTKDLALPACMEIIADPLRPSFQEISVSHFNYPGVSAHIAGLAELIGTNPKTLQNSLSDWPSAARLDHRWLMFLWRVEHGDVDLNALLFHERSPASVAQTLMRRAGQTALDAGDALLLFSLLALYQRRRRVEEVRATRGKVLPRRKLPKPITALNGGLIQLGMLEPLLEFASAQNPRSGHILIATLLEAALTEAHILPHRPRTTDSPRIKDAEAWLDRIDGIIKKPNIRQFLGETAAEIFQWRIASMRAWQNKQPPPTSTLAHPYVQISAAIREAQVQPSATTMFDPQTPGHFMLLPQARRLGLVNDYD